ncbi:MAG: alpha-galactosidase [Clostridia bacterium]|nr:alpha-galactosidase [Clostridia bacterium]
MKAESCTVNSGRSCISLTEKYPPVNNILMATDAYSPETLPISFTYEGKKVRGIPSDYSPDCRTSVDSSGIITTVFTGKDRTGLKLEVIKTYYPDFRAAEYLAFYSNEGNHNLSSVSDFRIFDGVLPVRYSLLSHGNGDTLDENGYEWQTDELSSMVSLSPTDGTSCKNAFPYMRLSAEDSGINIAVGWPAVWEAVFEKSDDGVRLSVGQKRSRMVLRPGEKMRTPRVTFVPYSEGNENGINIWRRWFLKYILPREADNRLKGKYCLHYFMADGKPEFTGATADNQVFALNKYMERGLRPDIWWVDAGWYKCNFQWKFTGDWTPDPERFPDGLRPIGEACEKNGIDFLLWFEPERVRIGTRFYEEHKDFTITLKKPDGSVVPDALLRLGNKECLEYITDKIDSVIKEGKVRIYRQDFNFSPKQYWEAIETEDRIGAEENLHVQGYLSLWDELRRRNPGLIIDSCASGGRRNDLETMRRSVTLHYTDVGYGDHRIKQKQHRLMFEWIPYFRAHNMNWDSPTDLIYRKNDNHSPDVFSFFNAMAPCITDMTDYRADDEAFALSVKMKSIWQRASGLMLTSDYYPLTECRKSAEDFYALEFFNPDTGDGMLQIISNNKNPAEVFKARLLAVSSTCDYVLENSETGEKNIYSGSELLSGVDFCLSPRSGLLFFISECK